jgi:hypothetical protein
LLDRLTHHVHILEMKVKAIGSPRVSVGPARRSIRQRQIKKHYQRQRAHRPHNNDRAARALAVKPAPAARRYAGWSSTARRDRANPSSVRRMSTADAPGAVMHFCSDAILFRRGHYSGDAMRPQHSHCGPLRGQVELVDEKRWPWRAAVRLWNR